MKFGRRLAQEAQRSQSRGWAAFYFDYKAIKTAIKQDIANKDAKGTSFEAVLIRELGKVSQFYQDRAGEKIGIFFKLQAQRWNLP